MDFVCIYTTDVSCNYVFVDSIFFFSSFLSIKAFQAFQAPRVDNNPPITSISIDFKNPMNTFRLVVTDIPIKKSAETTIPDYYSLREAQDIINYLDEHGAGFISDYYGLKESWGFGICPGSGCWPDWFT